MKPGDLVSHFRIVQRIAGGAMGEVFIAQDETLKRRVAIKTIHTTRKQRPDAHTRFAREARVLSQLDHPHICRIFEYISTDEDDLIVLELIEGRTLTALGDDLKYAQKLEIAEQIASALVAAHAEGIVHRDLKPGNIMLTRSSGVKVLDFGLACIANTEEEITPDHSLAPGEPQVVDWSASDDSISGFHTEFGRVFGTVQYMAPEQAEGETVGPAADMFSFGLVLQEIFTGTPARRLVKQDGLARAADGFSTPVEGLPSDLTDLITRLKERAPTRRPTALEAQKILQRIRSKPERRLRAGLVSAAALLAVGGITKYTFDLRSERAATEKQRQTSESTMSFMIRDLYDELEPIRRTSTLGRAIQRPLDYYAAIPVDALLPDQLVNYAQAWIQAGRVRGEDQTSSASLDAFNASLALLDGPAAAAVPEAVKARLRREALFEIGDLLLERGKTDLAESAFRSVAELAQEVNGQWDEDDPLPSLAWKGRVQTRLGDILRERGRSLEAAEQYESARECFHLIVNPNVEAQYESAVLEFSLYNLEMERNDYTAAEIPLRRQLGLLDGILAHDTSNLHCQESIASAHTNLGALRFFRDEIPEARSEFVKSVEVRRALIIHDAGNLDWKNKLAGALSWLASSELNLRQFTSALAALEEEHSIREALTAGDQTNMQWLRALTTCENNTADVLEILGRIEDANKLFKSAVAHSRRLIAADPSSKELELEHVIKLRRLGMNLTDVRDLETALQTLEEALSLVEPELSSTRPDPNRLLAIALCRNYLAELRIARNELDLANKELDKAASVLNLSALAGQDNLTRDARAFVHVTRGTLFERRGNMVEARAEAQAGGDLLETYFWNLFSGRRARALVSATRIAHGDKAVEALFDRFQANGYVHPPSRQSARGN